MSASMVLCNKERLLLSLVDNLRRDIERLCPRDQTANKLASELLYHFAWKISDVEGANED